MGSLGTHEARMQRKSYQPVDQAFQSQLNISNKQHQGEFERRGSKQRGYQHWRGCGNQSYGHGRGHSRGRRRGQCQNFQQKSNNSHCRICGKFGHQSSDCYDKCKKCRNPNHMQKHC